MPTDLDVSIGDALQELERYIRDSGWRGRENELVNLFAMGYLLPRLCPPMDPTQIAIEVAVPQVDVGDRVKAMVRKDLVVWEQPRTTAWTGENGGQAIAVLEWKCVHNVGSSATGLSARRREHEGDIAWLTRFTQRYPSTSGYAVFADLANHHPKIHYTVVRDGRPL